MAAARAFHLGLTGGIGSGKSTVSAWLAQAGAQVLDADAQARALTAPGGAAMAPIAQVFGSAFLTADGSLDRAAMRQRVFADPEAKARLEAIIHPLVEAALWSQAGNSNAAVLVFDVPLLVESGRWRRRMHWVCVVDCPPELQVARVCRRNAWSAEAVRAVMAQQASRAQRLACADIVLANTGSLKDLQHQVRGLAKALGLSSPGCEPTSGSE